MAIKTEQIVLIGAVGIAAAYFLLKPADDKQQRESGSTTILSGLGGGLGGFALPDFSGLFGGLGEVIGNIPSGGFNIPDLTSFVPKVPDFTDFIPKVPDIDDIIPDLSGTIDKIADLPISLTENLPAGAINIVETLSLPFRAFASTIASGLILAGGVLTGQRPIGTEQVYTPLGPTTRPIIAPISQIIASGTGGTTKIGRTEDLFSTTGIKALVRPVLTPIESGGSRVSITNNVPIISGKTAAETRAIFMRE